ncbi:MAG TPA: hypothetical protein VH088_20250 [Terriglobales bacterium]|jgi:hypothetical protein|nr:hypothetical protein [Terriglobales bacterium]
MCTEGAWRALKEELNMLLMVEKTSMQTCNGEMRAGKTPRAAKVSMEEICNGEWTIGGKAVISEDTDPRALAKK